MFNTAREALTHGHNSRKGKLGQAPLVLSGNVACRPPKQQTTNDVVSDINGPQSRPGVKTVYPNQRKELPRRPHLDSGWAVPCHPYFPGFDCGSSERCSGPIDFGSTSVSHGYKALGKPYQHSLQILPFFFLLLLLLLSFSFSVSFSLSSSLSS